MSTISDADICLEYETRPFDVIEARLQRIYEWLTDPQTNPRVRGSALLVSTINSIASLNTHVSAHEEATATVVQALINGQTDQEQLASAFNQTSESGRHQVLYYNSKAEWVRRNLEHVNFVSIADTLVTEGLVPAQQRLVNDVLGMKNRKAAFTLANLGWTNAACMDSVMERAFEVETGSPDGRFDAIEPFGTTVAERYYERIDRLRGETPEASKRMERYLWQWASWSCVRDDGFTMHNSWFALLDQLFDVDVFASDADDSLVCHPVERHVDSESLIECIQ